MSARPDESHARATWRAFAALDAGALFSGFARGVLELLLPRVCAACAAPMHSSDRGIACGACLSRVALLPHPQCGRCGHPTRGRACRWCEHWAPHVRAVRSVAWMPGGAAGRMVHALKYDGWTAVAEPMAERMARLTWPEDVIEERAALVPVPLAAARERERGYNQSLLLAQALAPRWGLPVWADVLRRERATTTQTRLTPGERLANVAGAFRADSAARTRLRGRHVVLVDDVVTTAATLSACARALVAGGARIVSCVTFGRARAGADRV